jgi:superfamily II DNA or RNA helicase
MSNELLPKKGTWVRKPDNRDPGVVINLIKSEQPSRILVQWLKSNRKEWLGVDELRSGFMIGMHVQDIPNSRIRRSLGEGVVVDLRRIGKRDQVLVDFLESGEKHWLPFQNLIQIKGVRHRFMLGQTGNKNNAERFRLRNLAYAIENWNENTGSLSNLDIDPLPHQIHLVHHILASGNLNWMIADDVGLGKTIEIGMLLSALIQRKSFRRILIVTPAGLVKQWRDELHYKFRLSDFQIYGEDFQISHHRNWQIYHHVIGSVDRFKSESHKQMLFQAGYWDLIIFDEAHNLSRTQYGFKYQSTERFRLAAALRKHTDSIILLSGTPHQGKQDKFLALLEILRPELKQDILSLSLNPEILLKMVIRNNKADVTDENGNFIFQGKMARSIEIFLTDEEIEFEKNLRRYLKNGYSAGKSTGGMVGRAIGFVMTIYRKLAASSIAAIEAALTRRLARLQKKSAEENNSATNPKDIDLRYVGEWEETYEGRAKEFFKGEIKALGQLIQKARHLVNQDTKSKMFIQNILDVILASSPDEKVLVFTEYRATQAYLSKLMEARYGKSSVYLIHGSQAHADRQKAIFQFEEIGQFLISTEAGGEGINLQRRCHVMVNFDLPWNPMRLVQRIGRLYRYGQKNRVVIFNIQSPQTIDGSIIELLYRRIDQVVCDMATLGGEFRPGLEAEILGELAEVIDVGDILEESVNKRISHTEESIEKALARAREAVKKQRDIFKYASGYNPDETRGELRITKSHLRAFIEGMIAELEIKVIETTHKGLVMRLRLPERIQEKLSLMGRTLKITLDRDIASRRQDIQMMDLSHPLLNFFLACAKRHRFDGRVCKTVDFSSDVLVTAMLRWQNDQGIRMRQEFVAILSKKNGNTAINHEEVSTWLLHPALNGGQAGNKAVANELFMSVDQSINNRLSEKSNQDLHPENCQLIGAAWSLK